MVCRIIYRGQGLKEINASLVSGSCRACTLPPTSFFEPREQVLIHGEHGLFWELLQHPGFWTRAGEDRTAPLLPDFGWCHLPGDCRVVLRVDAGCPRVAVTLKKLKKLRCCLAVSF